MTLIFSNDTTILIEGQFEQNQIKFSKNTKFIENVKTSILRIFRAMQKQQSNEIHLLQLTFENKSGILVYYKENNTNDNTKVNFVVIFNPLLNIPELRNEIVSSLNKYLDDLKAINEDTVTDLLFYFEKKESTVFPDSFLNYLPLSINPLFLLAENYLLNSNSTKSNLSFFNIEHPLIKIFNSIFLYKNSAIGVNFSILSEGVWKKRFVFNIISLY